MAAADDIGINEQVIHCRGAASLARDLAHEQFLAANWSLGNVVATDSGVENAMLPSGLQGESLIREVHVTADTLASKVGQEAKNELQFRIKGAPYPVNSVIKTSGSFRFVRLAEWQWYDTTGLLVFRPASGASGERAIGSPRKLPDQWRGWVAEAADLRARRRNWFLPGIKKTEVASMQAEATATNPLWRYCVMCRLLELKRLRREDIQKMLKASAGKPVEVGTLLFLLLNDSASHEEEIMEQVKEHGRDPGTAEGLALGCLTSAAYKPKPVEKAFASMNLLKNLEAKSESSEQDQHKMINAAFQGDEAMEYRIAHKLNLMIVDIDNELRQKVAAILFYMLKP